MPSRRRTLPGAGLGSRAGRPGRGPGDPPGRRRGCPPDLAPAPPAAVGGSRVLIDGRNVQRALERGAAAGSLPTAALIARLRAAFAPPTEVELILDGHPGPTPTGRVAPGFSVLFGRGTSADHLIGERVVDAFQSLGPADVESVLVVTDDREVRAQALRNGVRVQGTAWLARHLEARAAATPGRGTTLGHGRAPRDRSPR